MNDIAYAKAAAETALAELAVLRVAFAFAVACMGPDLARAIEDQSRQSGEHVLSDPESNAERRRQGEASIRLADQLAGQIAYVQSQSRG